MFSFLFSNLTNIFLAQAGAAATAIPAATHGVATAAAHHPNVGIIILEIIYALISLALVILVMMQPSKTEGLGVIMGGGMQNMFRGKQSVEQKLVKITTNIGITFVVLSLVICFCINRFGV